MKDEEKNRTDNIKPFSDLMFERIWQSYTLTDTRRMKSFYYLFSTMAIFIILWAAKEKQIELPLLKAKVDLFTALSLFPAFVMILSSRYFFLCAHTIKSMVTALKLIQDVYKEDIQKQKITFGQLYTHFKQRDLTESINIYFFPIKPTGLEQSPGYKVFVVKLSYFIANIAILLTAIFPILSYWAVILWIKENFAQYLSATIGYTVFFAYSFFGILFLLVPLYFYFRVSPEIAFFREQLFVDSERISL